MDESIFEKPAGRRVDVGAAETHAAAVLFKLQVPGPIRMHVARPTVRPAAGLISRRRYTQPIIDISPNRSKHTRTDNPVLKFLSLKRHEHPTTLP